MEAKRKPLLPGDIQLKAASGATEMDGMLELPVVEAPAVENVRGSRPDWLRVKLPYGETYKKLVDTIESNGLHTVCQARVAPTWENAGRQVQPRS